MIDTIKIYTEIDKNIYDLIQRKSIIKVAVDCNKDQLLYNITNDHLEGSYSSLLSVRVGCGSKYGFANLGYFIEIEGSYHKITLGYNSHNGFYDLNFICSQLILKTELVYDIDLPDLRCWFLGRVDIAICYDLQNQNNVKSYINSLSRCRYPRRKMRFFNDESVYLSGTSTSLKIYNKLLEFNKHDKSKFINTDFDLNKYTKEIQGFVRFECEIRKKKLQKIFKDKFINNHINVTSINYNDLKEIWKGEFMKLLNYIDNDLNIVRGRENVKTRLFTSYNYRLASVLYNFYSSIMLNGITDVKNNTSSSTFYRNVSYLKKVGIDLSQTYKIEEIEMYNFNPFCSKEVA